MLQIHGAARVMLVQVPGSFSQINKLHDLIAPSRVSIIVYGFEAITNQLIVFAFACLV